jgi:hypothetical protein
MPPNRASPEERILLAVKRLNLSMGQIREKMDATGGDLKHALSVPGLRGELRIQVRCRSDAAASWSMSVILLGNRFNGRIDCIDWEGLFKTMDGGQGSGFHRHIWSAKDMSCNDNKVALPQFRPAEVRDFILQGFAIMGVRHREDANDDSLPIH